MSRQTQKWLSVIAIAIIAILYPIFFIHMLQNGTNSSSNLAIELASGSLCIIAIVSIWSRFKSGQKRSLETQGKLVLARNPLSSTTSVTAKESIKNKGSQLEKMTDNPRKRTAEKKKKLPKGILLVLVAVNLGILGYGILANLVQREPALNLVIQVSVTILSVIGTISLSWRIKMVRMQLEKEKQLDEDRIQSPLAGKLSLLGEHPIEGEEQESATIQFGLYRLGRRAFLFCFTVIFGMIFFSAYMLMIYAVSEAGLQQVHNLFSFLVDQPVASSNLFTLIVLMGYVGAFLCALVVWKERDYVDDLYLKILSRLF